ncbi:hypothetical protein ACN47E_006773 [Coniothyrium glycines]
MHPFTSPRLPGVPILRLDATGSDFSRWRRCVKFALTTKGTWRYCDGTYSMPMPAAVPKVARLANAGQCPEDGDEQPSLLEERRAWVRQDREAKLDIFLSLAEDVMLELFGVGPPLPPSNLCAQDLMEKLAENFVTFDFEAYHHAFCHFLNLHVDQFNTLEDFNREFGTTLEDLLDHGHPLSNVQACSAYFSKIRCTQNPWVTKMLKQWHDLHAEPQLSDMMKKSPPWSVIRPLAIKSLQHTQSNSTTDVVSDNRPRQMGSDTRSASWASSTALSSMSSMTTQSQDIIISAATGDIAGLNNNASFKRPTVAFNIIPECQSSKSGVSKSPAGVTCTDTPVAISRWLDDGPWPAPKSPKAFIDRPLPLPPSVIIQTEQRQTQRSRVISPYVSEHPAFRTEVGESDKLLPANLHDSLRPSSLFSDSLEANVTPASSGPASPPTQSLPGPCNILESVTPAVHVAIPWPGEAEETNPPPDQPRTISPSSSPEEVHALRKSLNASNETLYSSSSSSTTSSLLSLPLQGTQDLAWDYVSGHLNQHSLLPVASHSLTALPPVQKADRTGQANHPSLMSRLSGDNVMPSMDEPRERIKAGQGRKGWNLRRLGHGRGLRA